LMPNGTVFARYYRRQAGYFTSYADNRPEIGQEPVKNESLVRVK